MTTPDTYEEGFGWGTVIMALFVGLLMTPAQMYLELVAGMGMGGAAQWVTVILYVEVARRAMTRLKRAEIYVLFYMCSTVMIAASSGFLMRQFLVQSEMMRKMGIAELIPAWYAPSDPAVLAQRSFFASAWLVPIALVVLGLFVSRLNQFGLGYVLFRLTSDVEQLPFPMAPIGAMGMTALADASNQRDTWRWRAFSIGGVAGGAFGILYVGIPNITSAAFGQQGIHLLPIPFVDLTSYTESVLPAFAVMISFDLGLVVTGMVLPFWSMVGAFGAMLITMVANPILYHYEILVSWERGIGGMQTLQSNMLDFYFSSSIGLVLAVAATGFIHMVQSLRRPKGAAGERVPAQIQWSRLFKPPANRGDFPLWVALAIWIFSTTVYITLSYLLVNYYSGALLGAKFPLWLLLFFGFVYTPFISYVSARMEGIVGMQVQIPYIREASFILSGYKGAAIWFAPIPISNFAGQTVQFRTAELTGTRFTSLIKAEILIFPIVVVGMLLFSQLIWSMGPVPSEMFPYANEFWELNAYQSSFFWSATLPNAETSLFMEAFKPEVVAVAFVLAMAVYGILNFFGLPIFLVYGIIRGLDQSAPISIVPMFIGAILGRYVLRKRFGDMWPQYRIVFAAGFSAGVGLIIMLSLGFVFIAKSVIKLPF